MPSSRPGHPPVSAGSSRSPRSNTATSEHRPHATVSGCIQRCYGDSRDSPSPRGGMVSRVALGMHPGTHLPAHLPASVRACLPVVCGADSPACLPAVIPVQWPAECPSHFPVQCPAYCLVPVQVACPVQCQVLVLVHLPAHLRSAVETALHSTFPTAPRDVGGKWKQAAGRRRHRAIGVSLVLRPASCVLPFDFCILTSSLCLGVFAVGRFPLTRLGRQSRLTAPPLRIS